MSHNDVLYLVSQATWIRFPLPYQSLHPDVGARDFQEQVRHRECLWLLSCLSLRFPRRSCQSFSSSTIIVFFSHSFLLPLALTISHTDLTLLDHRSLSRPGVVQSSTCSQTRLELPSVQPEPSELVRHSELVSRETYASSQVPAPPVVKPFRAAQVMLSSGASQEALSQFWVVTYGTLCLVPSRS